MKLIFGVFVTVLLATAMAFGQQYQLAANPASVGEDFYSQTIAAQAEVNSLVMAANALSASSPPEPVSWTGLEPGSMASNLRSPATDNEIFGATVAIQANANRLVLEANKF